MVVKPIQIKKSREQRAGSASACKEVIIVPSALGDAQLTPDQSATDAAAVDVIDLGAPRRRRTIASRSPRSPTTVPYTPNPRLYPGPRKNSERQARRARRKRVFRRPVPNSRLYRPGPPRPVPPPANPRTAWPRPASPPRPPHALDTASRAALRVLSARLASPDRPNSRLVVTLPARGMDAVTRHSASPECSEGSTAPSEFLAEFLSAIMRRQYAEALKYCRLILQYEPHNATARGFFPLLQHKVDAHRGDTSSSEEAISPQHFKNAGDSGGSGQGGESGESGPAGESAESEEGEEWERSGASWSSLELDSSRRTDRSSESAPNLTESSSASRDDNGNDYTSTPVLDNARAHSPPTPPPPLYGQGDIENENAIGEPEGAACTLKAASSGASSLRRLRAHFTCSIK
ncbi:uncharacterized protein LOC111003129 [Pieris rapae]|uniref:uncharacterized protein LOC111003129 n=1 Tax=Pieris rapae TaxID=64459 RepID=UPI001E27F979|nr:uncharacterized protein LOC111003129 [Pieris rapae]